MSEKMWNNKETDYLIKNFSNFSNQELSDKLNRSISSIINKANNLKIKKSKKHISKQIGKRNKIVGRELTYDILVNIASKYKTRGEFQYKDGSAYTTARIKGYLNDICTHMIKASYST